MEPPRVLSVSQLADRWGVTPAAIYAMISRGELAAFKPGGKLIRIKVEEIVRLEARMDDEEVGQPESAEARTLDTRPPPPLDRIVERPIANLKERSEVLLRTLPGWPLTMNMFTVAAYLDIPPSAVEPAVANGTIPRPVLVGGKSVWSRPAIDAAIEALVG